MGDGWNYDSIDEEDGGGENEKRFFHGLILLVWVKCGVILSWP